MARVAESTFPIHMITRLSKRTTLAWRAVSTHLPSPFVRLIRSLLARLFLLSPPRETRSRDRIITAKWFENDALMVVVVSISARAGLLLSSTCIVKSESRGVQSQRLIPSNAESRKPSWKIQQNENPAIQNPKSKIQNPNSRMWYQNCIFS